MEFIFRKADNMDVPDIMKIMKEVKEKMENPDWFVADEEDYIQDHIDDNGFIILAEQAGKIAGFFVVKKPTADDNLGNYLGFSQEQCEKVWIMDSAAVGILYRGNRLQENMLKKAEMEVQKYFPKYLMCTVHPDNFYSLNNMKNNGYQIMKKVRCYGGKERFILMKELSK